MIDFVVIGGGIAGMSAAAHLAPHGSVILLEMEPVLGYHATGRSAAMFRLNYQDPGSRALGRASQRFLENPPPGATDAPLLTDRGLLWVADQHRCPVWRRSEGEGEMPRQPEQCLFQVKK